MNNYNFEKRIYKNGITYCLEISLPNNFNNFFYKVYGNDGFYNYGKFSSYKNNETNNTLVINVNKVQYLFVSFILTKKNKEYYDFIDMNNMVNNVDLFKNIKLKVEREDSETSSINFKLIDNIEQEEDDKDDSDSSSDDESSVSSTFSEDSSSSSGNSVKKTILL